MPQQKKTPLHN